MAQPAAGVIPMEAGDLVITVLVGIGIAIVGI